MALQCPQNSLRGLSGVLNRQNFMELEADRNRRVCREHHAQSPKMIKTFSLSALFFLALGLLAASHASLPLFG